MIASIGDGRSWCESPLMSKPEFTLEQIRQFDGKYPKQLWYLFGTEMWERFCFYGMRGMLSVFMVSQLGLDDRGANLQYGAIQAFVYAFTFIGGLFADKILGFQKSLFWVVEIWLLGRLLLTVPGVVAGALPEFVLPAVFVFDCEEMELDVTRMSDCPRRFPAR